MAIAATAGFGGGNFASSMANISFFYPEKDKGWALGLNAAGGNIGVAVVQKIIPPIVIAGGGMALSRAGLFYVPLAVVAAVCAFLFMNNLTEAKADVKPVWQSLRHPDTWIMSLLYIGTFGSFIGYSAAFPTLLKTVFGRGDIALTWALPGGRHRIGHPAPRRQARRPDRRGPHHRRQLRHAGRRGRGGAVVRQRQEPAGVLRQLHVLVRRHRYRQRFDVPDDLEDLQSQGRARRRRCRHHGAHAPPGRRRPGRHLVGRRLRRVRRAAGVRLVEVAVRQH